MAKKNRKIMDSVFKDLFGEDRYCKQNFISLYNALSGSNLRVEETTLERKTIPQSVVATFDNDVSWEVNDRLIVLIEHQSTINNNMPFRCFEYVTRIYETIVESRMRYGNKLIKLPAPDFYVVYAGTKDPPLKRVMKLSDSFYSGEKPKLELIVNVLNCTNPENLPLKKNCDIIKQYRQFIQIVNQKYDSSIPIESIRSAINIAKNNGILTEYLKRKESEVTNMLCAEYDYDTDIAVKQEEAKEERDIETAVRLIESGDMTEERVKQFFSFTEDQMKEVKKQLLH